MPHSRKRPLCVFLALSMLSAALCGCRETDGPGADTAADIPTAAASAADTGAETASETAHVCEFDALGVCYVCGKTIPAELTNTTDCAALPHDALYYALAASEKLSLTVTLTLSGDGGYTLTKTLSRADSPCAVFTFTGAYTVGDHAVVLDAAETGTADADLTAFCHVKYRKDSASDPSVLDLFPTGYLCAEIANRAQAVTADGQELVFLCDDCAHPAHGENMVCTVCGRTVRHTLEGCECEMCAEKTDYEARRIPSKYVSEFCPEKGRVEKIVYDSCNYAAKSPYTNTVFIYLPYGYDEHPEMEYNVLYLLHGSGENAAYWLAQLSYQGGYTKKTQYLLDNLHYYKLCEPTIVVTPTENLNGTANFWREMEDYIIPLIETRYRTKAGMYGKDPADFTAGDMIVSRDSRAFAGLSLGSIITWDVMSRSIDKYAYYGFYSGGTCSGDRKIMLRRTLRNKGTEIYDVRFAYHSCGTDDVMYADHVADYKYFLKESDRLRDGENTVFLDKPGFKHNYDSWIIDLYNSLVFDFFKH